MTANPVNRAALILALSHIEAETVIIDISWDNKVCLGNRYNVDGASVECYFDVERIRPDIMQEVLDMVPYKPILDVERFLLEKGQTHNQAAHYISLAKHLLYCHSPKELAKDAV